MSETDKQRMANTLHTIIMACGDMHLIHRYEKVLDAEKMRRAGGEKPHPVSAEVNASVLRYMQLVFPDMKMLTDMGFVSEREGKAIFRLHEIAQALPDTIIKRDRSFEYEDAFSKHNLVADDFVAELKHCCLGVIGVPGRKGYSLIMDKQKLQELPYEVVQEGLQIMGLPLGDPYSKAMLDSLEGQTLSSIQHLEKTKVEWLRSHGHDPERVKLVELYENPEAARELARIFDFPGAEELRSGRMR